MQSGYQLDIKNVHKRFGTHEVLKGVDLSIRPGEFVAIVGRSGCGKSTLLRLISQLDSTTEGVILLDGKAEEKGERTVKFLFQEARLLPWKRVWNNISLVAPDHSRENAMAALEAVGLSSRADEWPSILSGGQKQRVSLARALASKSRLLLLDEPLGALDALTRIEMQQLIETLWEKEGFTAILVTHDVSEAVYLADRVVLIEEGEITMDYPIALARPRERDASFAVFEKYILDRVMHHEDARKMDYMI